VTEEERRTLYSVCKLLMELAKTNEHQHLVDSGSYIGFKNRQHYDVLYRYYWDNYKKYTEEVEFS
jgi:hypothetical protein